MILNTPKLASIGVFDANYPYTLSIVYEGEQVVRNRVIIRKNETYDIVYDKTQDGLRLNHVMEANILNNGVSYCAQVQVFDANGSSSNLSETVLFSCHTTPLFHFVNIGNQSVVTSANLNTHIAFTQAEGDSLKEYKYYLYDSNKSEMYSSNSFYSISDNQHTYYGLTNMTNYFIRAIGKTVYGFDVDTGYVRISVKYNCIPTNIAVQAENQDGRIILNVNIISTDYDLENSNYVLENGELTLTDNTIKYHVKDINDFSLIVKARNIPLNKTFINIVSDKGNLLLKIVEISKKYYCKLIAESGAEKCVIYKNILGQLIGDTNGNAISTADNSLIRAITNKYNKSTLIVFDIHRKNNLYSLGTYYQ